MGWGVDEGQAFESLLEIELNHQHAGKKHNQYEILNFSVPGYFPLQQIMTLDKALTFEPDAVFYVATGRELSRAAAYLVEVLQKGIDIPYESLRDIAKRAGVDGKSSEVAAKKALAAYQSDILLWVYQEIAKDCRKHGILPVWVFLPQIGEGPWQEETVPAENLAKKAGFVIVNLDGVYDNEAIEDIRVAEWDSHPNARGHQLVAKQLYKAFFETKELSAILHSEAQ
jgi:hypothetical protein